MVSAVLLGIVLFGVQDSSWPKAPVHLKGSMLDSGEILQKEPSTGVGTVLIFVATDCPISNRYAPEIKRIATEFGKKGFSFYRVYLEALSHASAVKKHTKDFGYAFPALLDPAHSLVAATKVRVTPEVAVLDREGKLVYRGRIDDQNIEHGKIRSNYRRDLRVALTEILAGKPVSVSLTAATGCFIGPAN